MAKSKKIGVMEMVKEAFQNGFIDDHTDHEDTCDYVGILTQPWKDKIYLIPLSERTSINPLYFCEEDGRLHLSTNNIGGILDAKHNMGESPETKMQIAVDAYNRERRYSKGVDHYNPFEYMQLICRSDWEKKNAAN